jgi:hypothetical protein
VKPSRPNAKTDVKTAVSLVAQQACWFCCVLGAGSDVAIVGVVGTVAFVGAFVVAAKARWREVLVLVLASTATGVVVDSVLVVGGAIAFPPSVQLGPLPTPLWMVALWTGFATTLWGPLRGLLLRWPRALLAGALLGPLAYVGGSRLGPLVIRAPFVENVALIAVAWASALLALSMLVRAQERSAP